MTADTTFDADVLVLGAGPVGKTLANELIRHGTTPRIIDRAPGIREVSKAMILHVRTQEVLDRVGITDRLASEAQALTEVVVHAYGKHIGAWDLENIDSAWKHPLIIGQNRTQHALQDLLNARGVEVAWNTEAVSISMDPEGVTTELRVVDAASEAVDQRTIRTRYVVGCEGSNSLVRRTLNFSFDGERYTGEQFIQADCQIRWALPKGRSYLFLTPVGYLMVIEFPNDLVRVFISLPDQPAGHGALEAASQPGAVEATSEEPSLDDVAQHLTALSGYACELSNPIWLARYRTSHRYADRFSHGCAFIAGDAGHVHVPIGGQGMNTGIQDAFNLAWKLAGVAQGKLRPEVLESYHAERHPVAEALIKGTNFAYTGILHPSAARQHAARLFGPFLIRNQRVQGFMRNTLEELKVSYPASPLNLDLGGTSGPAPGERVLDTTLVRASDRVTVTLRELTRGTHWTLLLFGGSRRRTSFADLWVLHAAVATRVGHQILGFVVAADKSVSDSPAPQWTLLDALGLAHERYGVTRPAFYLLRPDTYVAARGPIAATTELLAHLDAIFTDTAAP